MPSVRVVAHLRIAFYESVLHWNHTQDKAVCFTNYSLSTDWMKKFFLPTISSTSPNSSSKELESQSDPEQLSCIAISVSMFGQSLPELLNIKL
jgi:hypothetical protein